MKVLKDFYCIKTKKTWVKGQDYTGKRKDLKGIVVSDKEYEDAEAARKKQNDKLAKASKKMISKIGKFGQAKHQNKKAPETKKGATEKK